MKHAFAPASLGAENRWEIPAQRARYAYQEASKPPNHRCQGEDEDGRCPYCQQPFDDASGTIPILMLVGCRQLIGAVSLIGACVFRCVRFVIAGALCLVGLIGACFRKVGLAIAHPRDRRVLGG